MYEFILNIFLIMAQISRLSVFTVIAIFSIIIGIFYKKSRKYIFIFFNIYLPVFVLLFPVTVYGIDSYHLWVLKKRLAPQSFEKFKEHSKQIKILREKREFSYYLLYDIKYLDKEYEKMEKALQSEKNIEKNFIVLEEIVNKT